MQRLSLAELKAKANVLNNTEFITGGTESGCHPDPPKTPPCGTTSNQVTIEIDPNCKG